MQQGLVGNLLWFINRDEGGIVRPHREEVFHFKAAECVRQMQCCNLNARLKHKQQQCFQVGV